MALVEVGRYSPLEAPIIVGRLESDGIVAFAFDAGARIVKGSIAALIPGRVTVDDEDLLSAKAVINPA